MSISYTPDFEQLSGQLTAPAWHTEAPSLDDSYFEAVESSSYSPKRKARPTRAQVAENLDIFRPSPKLTPRVTQTKILQNRGHLMAFLDVDLYLGNTRLLMMRGVRIIKQNDGTFYAQLPHQQGQKGKRYYPIIRCYDLDLKRDIQQAALDAYNQAVSDRVIQLTLNLSQEVKS